MVYVVEDVFGSAVNPFTKQSEVVRRFTLSNDMQMSVQIITLGATITSFKVTDASGNVDDIVLGYDNVAGYQTTTNPYFGATVGRVCNRVANGRFQLNGQEVQVSRNWNNKHQLHGGYVGFDKAHWQVLAVHKDGVSMEHISPDGHEGYPGKLTASVRYTLTEDNCLHVYMTARTTQTTVVNMTNHSYFNLAGHAAGKKGIDAHSIWIKADHITETDADSIPTGKLLDVKGTTYDLNVLGNLGERLRGLLPTKGFDDNFCIQNQNNGISVVAKAYHPGTGRWLEVASNQPGVQFYTSNFMPDEEAGQTPIDGKSEAHYVKQGAFCLETQKWPDAVNHPNFPSIILQPEDEYNHEIIYKFGICRSGGCQEQQQKQ